ncbi:DUF1127 domain-containing protein [Halocynthiibacter sp. C4]|uniref:DUF1127 domain-containing protein n=1 Tax=Halocynthiibacter sp. C4 TaxID=2992758 RepID=UPI00237B510B|nr:DUF1127 domain-containing protein [Halocynthiibacter sp. C4]MDE0590224.1 DUF1127 domain-containing protein [Halocynthiibacter sp. C4]
MTHALSSASSCGLPRSTSFTATLRQAFAVYAQRRTLAKLDTDALDDLGLSRAEAQKEANRAFWDF